jgi:hypothetical protein
LEFVEFPGYEVSYSKTAKGMVSKFLVNLPSIIRWTKRENRILEDMIEKYNLDAVISDNRFGLYSNKIPGIFITHQIFIKASGSLKALELQFERFNLKYISRHTECWIPDHAGEKNLSGELSHKKELPQNCHFIGPLSRFSENYNNDQAVSSSKQKYDVLFLLSGPEPQRSIFEDKIIDQLYHMNIRSAVLQGKPGSSNANTGIEGCDVFPHLSTAELKKLILQSRLVISRSGYSTVMDLVTLGKNAVFVPTPGQTEQEYLARYYLEKGMFNFVTQEEFDLEKLLFTKKVPDGIDFTGTGNKLKERVKNLVSMISKHV